MAFALNVSLVSISMITYAIPVIRHVQPAQIRLIVSPVPTDTIGAYPTEGYALPVPLAVPHVMLHQLVIAASQGTISI
jgi:hypothetical protein